MLSLTQELTLFRFDQKTNRNSTDYARVFVNRMKEKFTIHDPGSIYDESLKPYKESYGPL